MQVHAWQTSSRPQSARPRKQPTGSVDKKCGPSFSAEWRHGGHKPSSSSRSSSLLILASCRDTCWSLPWLLGLQPRDTQTAVRLSNGQRRLLRVSPVVLDFPVPGTVCSRRRLELTEVKRWL